ncbi:hypothetical protein CH249_09960 [Rhodococcus sp. 05-2255-3B1]|uniref:ImmA/IrrE family metallo-endopeptidase n=1 Tax=unclassified Rhodococcus (in: high G+C Gram-positive bacteria) TaxID=192944 RepID=UPI000B9A489D|nr:MULTISPECIES: ImmA/IrrE family metallo-endopeptidase [unclassified Rhodococcus (in: high G+C Gram-positive bacteria)]OZE05142.1 hypothetical protein CH250_20275 [Rhodococcus sp. 05-2255-3C]OZE11782.1 hypothetical protein CH249_09960 [Rhodococcus sp. 05-2255-3B1]OZE24189.1 hypothetical protein CH255_02465 [Rhodococcus sp. 05-2255-2A2]
MPTRQQLKQAQSKAAMEATRLHREMGTKFDNPVDVLQMTRDLNLVLMMQPLDNLLGFYVRRSEAAGIVISSRIPESLQRFTLAHELGHHILGHDGSVDASHELDRFDEDSILEVEAQAFAASLLMPLPLTNRALRDLPATRSHSKIQDSDAYLFSRQLGVSFSAGVWALHRKNLISSREAGQMIKRGALAAKSALIGGAPVSDARADIWTLTEENNDLTVLCRVGDEIQVRLNEDTSTGRVWIIQKPKATDFESSSTQPELSWDGHDSVSTTQSSVAETVPYVKESLRIAKDEHLLTQRREGDVAPVGTHLDLRDAAFFPGDGGVREIVFIPQEVGSSRVEINLKRPWVTDDPTSLTYQFSISTRSRQLAGAGLFAPDPDTWVVDRSATA